MSQAQTPAAHDVSAAAHSSVTAGPEDRLRANTYSVLGSLLAAAPGADTLAVLANADPGDDGETLLTAAWRMLAAAAGRATPAEIVDEYETLFIGLGRGELVPFGSWYLTGFLMEQPLAQLRSDLARLGFERRADVNEPEDHVAALCETMALLGESDEAGSLELQADFFDRHIRPWMARFFRDLSQTKSARFYRAVGQLGEQFIELETRYIDMIERPPSGAVDSGQ